MEFVTLAAKMLFNVPIAEISIMKSQMVSSAMSVVTQDLLSLNFLLLLSLDMLAKGLKMMIKRISRINKLSRIYNKLSKIINN